MNSATIFLTGELFGLQIYAASGRNSEHDKQEKAQSDANGSEQHNNAFDRGDLSKRQFLEKEALNAEK